MEKSAGGAQLGNRWLMLTLHSLLRNSLSIRISCPDVHLLIKLFCAFECLNLLTFGEQHVDNMSMSNTSSVWAASLLNILFLNVWLVLSSVW